MEGNRTGWPIWTVTRRPSLGPSGPTPHLGEQVIAAPLGFAGNQRQPVGRSVEHRLLDLPGRQGQLKVVAYEHASRLHPAGSGS
jgi:hypothetical protein